MAKVVNILSNSGLSFIDLGYIASPLDGIITNTGGEDATIPLANSINAGLLSPGDFDIIGTISSLITQTITNGDTTHAPSGDAVFDALALKANITQLHNPVTIGTANGLSLSTQVLSLALASTSTTGALSLTDWNTFNNKQNTITNPITGIGTINKLSKFGTPNSLVDSSVSDTGSLVTISNPTVISGIANASSGIAIGSQVITNQVAVANNDILIGLDINPSFTIGAFTGVSTIGMRISGHIFPSVDNGYVIGSQTENFYKVRTRVIEATTGGALTLGYDGIPYAKIFESTGNLLLKNSGVFIDAGYRLDVQGTARLANTVTLGTQPTTSATTYDVLTRNTISGVIEKVLSTSFQPGLGFTPENVANKQNNLTIDGTGIKYPTVDAVNDALSLKVSSIVAGTNVSVNSFDPQNPIISAIPATSAGIFDRVYFTGQVASVTTPVAPNYDTIRNGKGSVASISLISPAIAASSKVFFTSDLIGPAQAVAGSLPSGNFTSFLSVLPSSATALKRFTIEVFLCDNAGVIIPQSGPVSTDPSVFYAGKNTVVILDSGNITLPATNSSVGLSGYLNSSINVAAGQRFRYHISVARGAGGGAQTMNVNIGNTWNSYIEAPIPLTTSTVINTSLVPGATATDALNALAATSHAPVTIATANGLSLATQTLSLALASTSTVGALSSADWNIFNGKQTALNGTGFVKATGTTISYDNTAYYPASNPNNYTSNTGTVIGSGTVNLLSKWTGTGSSLGNSQFYDISNNEVGVTTTFNNYSQFFIKGINSGDVGGGSLQFANQTKIFAIISGEVESAGNGMVIIRSLTGGVVTEKVRIISNGNVGIGTIDPTEKLHIKDGSIYLLSNDVNTGRGRLKIRNTDGSKNWALVAGTEGYINSGIGFRNETDSNNPLFIHDNGNVVLTNVTPVDNGNKLQVVGNVTVTGTVTASGGLFNSDIRLKDIVKRDGDVIYFKWKDGRDNLIHIGYEAQEKQTTHPDQVQKGADDMLTLNYIELLVEKIRDLEKRIQELETK